MTDQESGGPTKGDSNGDGDGTGHTAPDRRPKSTFSGFGLDLPGHLAAHHPAIATVILVVVIALAALAIPKLHFDDNVQRVFASRAETTESRTSGRNLVVLVESETPFDAADFTAMRDFSLDLQLLDGAQFVLSPFSMRFPASHAAYPGEAVFPFEIADDEIEVRLEAYRASAPDVRPLISADRMSALVFVAIDGTMRRGQLRAKMEEVRTLAADFTATGLKYELTGVDAIAFDIAGAIKTDLIRLNAAGCVIAILLAYLIFSTLRTTLVVVAPALVGAMVSLALFVVLGFPVTVLSNVVPILVLVLGIADSIHLTMHYLVETEGSRRERLVQTISDVGPACALTALTTAIGFSAIGVTNNAPLRELAILGASGVMASFLVVLVSFTLLAPFCRPPAKSRRGFLMRAPVPAFVSRWALGRPRLVVLLAALVTLGGLYSVSRTEMWFPLFQNMPEKSAVRLANDRIETAFGGYFRLWIDIDITGDNALETPEGWARMNRLVEAVEKAAPDYSVLSVVSAARWLGKPAQAPSADDLERLDNSQRNQLFTPDGEHAHVIVFVPEPMRDHATLAIHDAITEAAMSAGAERVYGFPAVLRHNALPMIRQLAEGLMGACVIAVIVVAAAFRWPMLAPALLFPNALPLILSAAALHLFNDGQVNPTAVLALTVAFGIAVDDSIHFANRYRLERSLGLSVDEALDVAICQTGRVMIITTVLIAAGVLVTLTSAFSTVRLFGLMLITTFFVALAADLLLLPAILRLKWFRRPKWTTHS
ncbi:MMPL family transporter [Breoghania sp.]|uniref:efflux RND transporter permease subunit n=1 Tax=Breoghania sp. TaxID=2065378 RepID=UPI002AA876EF|nr:MMPL family transporter [Breoghania sp.]